MNLLRYIRRLDQFAARAAELDAREAALDKRAIALAAYARHLTEIEEQLAMQINEAIVHTTATLNAQFTRRES